MLRLSKPKVRLLVVGIVFLVVLFDHSLISECSFFGRERSGSSKVLISRIQSIVDQTATNYEHQQFSQGKSASIPLHIVLRGGGSCSDSDVEEEEEYLSLVNENGFEEEDNVNVFENENENEDVDENPIETSWMDDEDEEEIDEGGEEEVIPEEESNIEIMPSTNSDEGDEIDKISSEDSANGVSNDEIVKESGRKENRRTSDIILELDRRSSVSGNDESLALRQMITERTTEYVYELQEVVSHLLQSEETSKVKLPHPRKLLHSLAKRVPAIKQSPDVNLRIHSSRADIDPGVAACIIGRVAFACEQYEQVQKSLTNEDDTNDKNNDDNDNDDDKLESAASQLISDRRFEQLVECVISGVNIKRRKAESLQRELDNSGDEISNDIEEVLDEEDVQFTEGLNIRDACRAAWGIAILGAHHLDTMGGAPINDLLLALSLRIRELLLARLQLLRQGDILSSDFGLYYQDGVPSKEGRLVTLEERMNELAEELAEDAASAMWAFGCVKACTEIKSNPLFEACCSILCQNPVDLRRRAQEAEYQPDKSPPIGSSDVVDRLAHSEAVAAEEGEVSSETWTTSISNEELWDFDNKYAFLDWLSPVEVTDILWALALHGSNTTSTKDKDDLSETASTLRETAYDRLVEWLGEDLVHNDNTIIDRDQEVSITENELANGEVTVIEVVDAAALLAAENEESLSMKSSDKFEENVPMPTESIAVQTGAIVTSETNTQEVEVVDAATLLASTIDGDTDDVVVETEVMVAPTSVIEGSSVASEVDKSKQIQEKKSPRIFSSHDLASIAWSVTELRDPLRNHIVGSIIELLWRLGPGGISDLSGADLSNLAWAIAKYDGVNHDVYSLSIIRWIADHALQRTAKYSLLRIFQPPELGRIMWAIACTTSTHTSVREDATGNEMSSIFLTRKALKAAVENLPLFSTETLVRIAWAHVEINDSDLTLLDSFETMALGRILAAAEHSLHRWERVDFAGDVASVDPQAENPLFSSFFGRPRINLPILEQDVNDDDDEDDMALAPLTHSQRPKLRDLMIDPSTLCKAASAFQRLSKKHPYIKGGWTFTRVAVRLLSSKNARLMKECSVHDVVRLCEAAVLSDVDGHGRELIIGLFARQVVKVMNEVLEDGSQHDTSINIALASSSELSTLIWALGEMGVKYTPVGPGKQLSSKKMRLGFVDPLLRGIQVTSLNLIGLERLVRGLALLKITPNEQPFLLSVLTRIYEELPNISSGSELCSLAEAIGILKEASKANSKKKEKQIDEAPLQSDNDDESSTIQNNERELKSVQQDISRTSDDLLNSIASAAVELSENLTANEIRRLLEVFSLLPFQADAMINSLSEEVSSRLEAIQNLRRDQSLGVLLRDANKKSAVVRNSLFDDSNTSLFGSIKARIVSIFGSSNVDEEEVEQIDDEGTKMTEEIASIVQDSIEATFDAAHRAEVEQHVLQLSLDKVIQALEEGTSFELGRSQELIENYYRTEFATGQRRSRCEKDRKNYIAKRVLSRLFP